MALFRLTGTLINKPVLPVSLSRGLPSVMSGLSVLVQPAEPVSLIYCVSSSEMSIKVMHFHNSCTRNCDHHIVLIMTGNAHKESCHKLSFILVKKKG